MGFGGLTFQPFGEGAFQEEDHEVIVTKLEGGLAGASAGGGPHTGSSGKSPAALMALRGPQLPRGYPSPAVGQASVSPPALRPANSWPARPLGLQMPRPALCLCLQCSPVQCPSPHLSWARSLLEPLAPFHRSAPPATLCTYSVCAL